MSAMANTTPIVTTVTKPATKEKTSKDADATPSVNIQDFCEEHYEDIMPVIMDKIRRDKRKEIHARLDFGERAARVWFDEIPPESIDGYKDLKPAFLAYFMQQKKYVKDPIEIHNIKQRDGETIEEFMERFEVETRHMKRAPECMRIFGFIHGVNNPELTKRLNEHVLKTMEEMMIATTTFIRGEATAVGKKKGHAS
ncbi:reverse transcriptase domain-containing protein [Tanacetum coccineum]